MKQRCSYNIISIPTKVHLKSDRSSNNNHEDEDDDDDEDDGDCNEGSSSYGAWPVQALQRKGAAISLFLFKHKDHVKSNRGGNNDKDSDSSSNSDINRNSNSNKIDSISSSSSNKKSATSATTATATEKMVMAIIKTSIFESFRAWQVSAHSIKCAPT